MRGVSRGAENAGPLDALVRVRMTAGMDPDCFEFEIRLSCRSLADLDARVAQLRDAGGITSTILVLHRVRLEA